MKCLVLGVWCNAQVLDLVRAGVDLVRRRRSLANYQPTEPSPSTRQIGLLPSPCRIGISQPQLDHLDEGYGVVRPER